MFAAVAIGCGWSVDLASDDPASGEPSVDTGPAEITDASPGTGLLVPPRAVGEESSWCWFVAPTDGALGPERALGLYVIGRDSGEIAEFGGTATSRSAPPHLRLRLRRRVHPRDAHLPGNAPRRVVRPRPRQRRHAGRGQGGPQQRRDHAHERILRRVDFDLNKLSFPDYPGPRRGGSPQASSRASTATSPCTRPPKRRCTRRRTTRTWWRNTTLRPAITSEPSS